MSMNFARSSIALRLLGWFVVIALLLTVASFIESRFPLLQVAVLLVTIALLVAR